MSRKKIVLYQPQQVDRGIGPRCSGDMLPLEMLCISSLLVREGYEIQIIDANLYDEEEGHRRAVEACEGALLYATSGILGYMVTDGFNCSTKVKAEHPKLPMIIGGWFASVRPDLQLGTGLYDAVVLAQGEFSFYEVVKAIESGTKFDDIAGLALWRDGQVFKTEKRPVVGWEKLPNLPWHLIDIEPYREMQLRSDSHRQILRMPTPPAIGSRKPYFGITYFSSYGCPEPCTFCCSPIVTDRRWKAMPADRMLDDLADLKERWNFDVVRFHDANFGVMQKRVKEFADGMLSRNLKFHWNAFLETHSILSYKPEVLDALAASGLYIAEIGAEAGTDQMMSKIGKPISGDDNINAAVEMDKRGVCSSVTYIIGYPGEQPDSMIATIDQCRRLHVAAPLARPTVWPYRPIPGTVMWDQAVSMGYRPPQAIKEWGSIGEYHLEETWPGKIPPHVAERRKLYQHFVTLSYGLARGKIGWWEKRAEKRLRENNFKGALWEARAFDVFNRVEKKLRPREEVSRSWVDPGHKTGTAGNAASKSSKAMTGATHG
ncbi:MAG: B12-binding domain-containing radical SAM protein [Planctomycetes bacterium]|nr:B12-binding domain-containing radical SAM protein [Planctomycetota bacterium]